MMTVFVGIPRTPFVNRTPHAGILQLASFAGKNKNVGHEHFGNALLVMDNVGGTIGPGDRRFHRRFGFAYNHRDAVDDIY